MTTARGEQLRIVQGLRHATASGMVIFLLTVLPPRKSQAEAGNDFKFMYYQEDKSRIRVLAPTFSTQHETENGWTIKLDGIYNAISGATPTGAPPKAVAPAPSVSAPRSSSSSAPAPAPVTVTAATPTGESEHEGGNDTRFSPSRSQTVTGLTVKPVKHISAKPAASFAAVTGASQIVTPPPATPTTTAPATTSTGGASGGSSGGGSTTAATPAAPAPSSASRIPLADFSDTRWAFNIGLSKHLGQHTPGGQFSFSQESDYQSVGLSLQDAIDFNRKNTTLSLGAAVTHDTLNPANGRPSATKDSVDFMVGVTQVLTPVTLFTANLSIGEVSGFISDPYKVVELNGDITYEKRPDSKTKEIVYLGLEQFITPLDASIELGLRHYQDSYGITSETVTLAWFQKLGSRWVLSPSMRYYTQTAADFYDVRFSGSPEFYSSDYRVSALTGMSYGLKAIWTPTTRLTLDIGVDRYTQQGNDGKTDPEMYPASTVFIVGAHWAL